MVEIKLQKAGQRGRAAHADDIDAAGVDDLLHRQVKALGVQLLHGVLDALDVHRKHLADDVAAVDLVAGDLHALHRGQAVADDLLQGLLQLGIAVAANLGGKADDGGFADADGGTDAGSGHKGGFFIMLQNVVGNALLRFGKLGKPRPDLLE